MSILIKGIEMPTSCIACLLNFGEKRPEYGLTIYCPYSDGVISWRDKAFDNGRLASCGIVPVPPHGKLGDLDALIAVCERQIERHKEQAEKAAVKGTGYTNDMYIIDRDRDIISALKAAPIIIEAEEVE